MTTEKLTRDDLRGLFLFEALTDDQLGWLAERGTVRDFPAGADVCTEGQPAELFFVLLSGSVVMYRMMRGDEVEVTRTDQRGSYAGATRAYVRDQGVPATYSATMRAVT